MGFLPSSLCFLTVSAASAQTYSTVTFYVILLHQHFYRTIIMLSNRYPATGGGESFELILSFLVSCAAGVACHYIIKWLDGDK